MRWFWIDRYVEFVRATRAVGVKCLSLGGEQFDKYFHYYPVMPPSLIIEGIAQTGGLVVGEALAFACSVVLAKVSKAVFHRLAFPGQTLRYEIEVQDIGNQGASVHGKSYVLIPRLDAEPETELQAEVELLFAFVDEAEDRPKEIFHPPDLVRWLRSLGVWDIGVDEQGQPLQLPERLRLAELDAAGPPLPNSPSA